MYCTNCGRKIEEGAAFCTYCGKRAEAVQGGTDAGPDGTRTWPDKIDTQPGREAQAAPAVPKRRRNKLIVAAVILLLVVIFLIAAALVYSMKENPVFNGSYSRETDDTGRKKERGEAEASKQEADRQEAGREQEELDEWIQSQEYDVDLSMYDDHGEWHNGRMWVRYTEEGWDANRTYLGYIDQDGNLIGEPHSVDEDDPACWTRCGNFYGDYTLVRTAGANIRYFDVINLSGEAVEHIQMDFYQNMDDVFDILCQRLGTGTLFYAEWRDEGLDLLTMLKVTDQGVKKITASDLNGEPVTAFSDDTWYMQPYPVNGYYIYLFTYNGFSKMAVYDQNAEQVFDAQMDFDVEELYTEDGKTFRVRFTGADGNDYFVNMDSTGNMLNEPEKAD